MKMSKLGIAIAAMTATLALGSVSVPASAQNYPNRAVKFVSPFPPGTGVDIVARAVGDKLSQVLGQPVVVENRPGAGGTVGEAMVAKATPDGYTVLIQSSSHTVTKFLYKNLAFDPVADFIPVTPLAVLPNVMVAAPNNGKFKTVKELVAWGKANPGKLNYASAGVGSATHMNDEKFRVKTGLDAVHIPFKGTPEAMTDIMAGRVDFMFTPIVSAINLIKGGKLIALSVASDKRSPQLPDVPTTTEAGFPGTDYVFWVGMLLPAKTPAPIVAKLYQETTKVLATKELKDRLASLGAEPWSMKSADFDAYLKKELAENEALIKAAHIQAN